MNSKEKLKSFLENLEKGKYLTLNEQLKDVMLDKCAYKVSIEVAKKLGLEVEHE